VFVDENRNGLFDSGEPAIKRFGAHPNVVQDTTATRLLFTSSGFSTLGATSTVDLCHRNVDAFDENNRCRRVSITPSGNVTVATIHSGQESS
jgi:hypothetical protein